jgi:hypothetical protein
MQGILSFSLPYLKSQSQYEDSVNHPVTATQPTWNHLKILNIAQTLKPKLLKRTYALAPSIPQLWGDFNPVPPKVGGLGGEKG